MNSKTFCVAPFIGTEFRKNGELAPCCRYASLGVEDKTWNFRNFDKWWEQDLEPMRQELLNGIEHAGCDHCWRDQKLGVKSYRESINEQYAQYTALQQPLATPVDQMYNFGNFCNLKCIMCSPYASSQIETEYKQHQAKFDAVYMGWQHTPEIKWFRSDEFVDVKQRIVGQAQHIMFQGGEPFMSPDVLEVLRNVVHPETTNVTVTTNMTVFTDEIIELLKKFQNVQLTVSLEGVGTHNNYLRFGSDWAELEVNINRTVDHSNFKVNLAHTFQRTSLSSWIPLLKFALNNRLFVSTTILHTPLQLAMSGATDQEKLQFFQDSEEFLKFIDQHIHNFYQSSAVDYPWEVLQAFNKNYRIIKESVKQIREYVESVEYDPATDQKFWTYIDLLDSIRGTNFSEVFDRIPRP